MDVYLGSVESKKLLLFLVLCENVSLSEASNKEIFLLRMLKEVTCKDGPVTIYNDSQSVQALANNFMHHEKTKHIDVKCHFVREQVQAGMTVLKYLNTNEMLADILTKPLPKGKLNFFVQDTGIEKS
jgi:hypothetical protein